MARYNYEIRLGFLDHLLTNVQSFSITKGRQQVQDPYKAGTATITGRVPSGLPTVTIGDQIEIYCVDPTPEVRIFAGTVADFRVNYGMVSSMDTWQIDCEDSFAGFGRALTSDSAGWAAGTNTYSGAAIATVSAGLDMFNLYPVSGSSTMSAQSVPNTNLLNVLQQIIFTEQGRLVNLGLAVASQKPALGYIARSVVGALPAVGAFSDGTVATALNTAPFDVVQFNSQADSFFSRVVVEPEGLADQAAGLGTRVFTGKSYDSTTTQAGNLASFVLATLDVDNAVPQFLSCNSEVQSNDVALNTFASAGEGVPVVLLLRGVKYDLFAEGGTLTANPDETRFSFNLVSSEATVGFVLDSATFGVLDQNKLGF